MRKKKARSSGRGAAGTLTAAVAWYSAEQWAKLKEVADDRDTFHDSHEAWQRDAENFESQLRGRGIDARRVLVDVDSLVAWCRLGNKENDGQARSEYAAETMQRR